MGHGIDISEATGAASAAYYMDAAWHGLGVVTDRKMKARESLAVANIEGLDYRLAPQFAQDGDSFVPTGKYTTLAQHPFTGEARVIGGDLSEAYSLDTPEAFADFADLLVEGGAWMNAVGLINEGRHLFFSLHVADLLFGGVEAVSTNLFLTTGMDGSLARTGKLLNYRVECANMHRMALGQRAEYEFKMKHTSPLESRVQEARDVLSLSFKASEEFEAEVQRLLDADVTNAQFAQIVERFIPLGDDPGKAKVTRVERERSEVHAAYRYGNQQLVHGTAWGAYNALTDWLDHLSGSSKMGADERMVRSMTDPLLDRRKDQAMGVVKGVLQLV